MPALTNVDLRLAETDEPYADAWQARGHLTIRHGDPESPTAVTIDEPTSLVELAVVLADALAESLARQEISENTRARLDYAARILNRL